jgi:hypothetical protein
VQPPDVGPFVDTVVLLFDDVRVTVTASGVATGSDFSEVESLAAAVQQLAAG